MKTYLVVWYSSEGTKVSDVVDRLLSMGFRTVKGNYDYEYSWNGDSTLEDATKLADKVHETLADCNVLYKIETI